MNSCFFSFLQVLILILSLFAGERRGRERKKWGWGGGQRERENGAGAKRNVHFIDHTFGVCTCESVYVNICVFACLPVCACMHVSFLGCCGYSVADWNQSSGNCRLSERYACQLLPLAEDQQSAVQEKVLHPPGGG